MNLGMRMTKECPYDNMYKTVQVKGKILEKETKRTIFPENAAGVRIKNKRQAE